MSAQELRGAADLLRGLIGEPDDESEGWVIPGPWHVSGHYAKFEIVPERDEDYGPIAHTEYGNEAQYIATMHPGVGLALADWLDEEADRIEHALLDGGDARPIEPALRTAEAILGGAS